MEKFKEQVRTLVEQGKTDSMEVSVYVEMLEECLKLFAHFGTVIRLAFIGKLA